MQKDLRHLFIGGVLFRLAADASLVSAANHIKIQQSKQRNMCVCVCAGVWINATVTPSTRVLFSFFVFL